MKIAMVACFFGAPGGNVHSDKRLHCVSKKRTNFEMV